MGERPLTSSSCISMSSSIAWTKPQALTFFGDVASFLGEDFADLTTTASASLTADSSSIYSKVSFFADYLALGFLAEAAPLSFLAAEALPESKAAFCDDYFFAVYYFDLGVAFKAEACDSFFAGELFLLPSSYSNCGSASTSSNTSGSLICYTSSEPIMTNSSSIGTSILSPASISSLLSS